MNPEEIKSQITNDFDEIKRQVEEYLTTRGQVDEKLKCALLEWASARALRDALAGFIMRPENATGVHTLAQFAWWRDKLPVISSKILASSIGGTIQSAWNSFISSAQQLITLINQGLWTLLSTLLTVKEWSLTGGIGAGALGLTGNVEIEITFA